MQTYDVAIIGAGPIGLELAAALKELGVDYVQFDAGQIGQTITWYPRQTQYFSSPDRIAIAGVPLHTADQTKATGEEYLAYLRGIVEQFDLHINTYEKVLDVQPQKDGFNVITQRQDERRTCWAKQVILTIGDMHAPRLLHIPGEDLPHVTHYFDEPHRYFRRRLLVVGGRNSAVEAALRCHRAGADVTMSYRGETFPDNVKYWLKPEINWLIDTGVIGFHPCTIPTRITSTHVTLKTIDGSQTIDVEADDVLLMTGYIMDTTLLERAGVELMGENKAPKVDLDTMQTNVPGLFVAGTAAAGTQVKFRLFIENCHPHVVKICRAICGQDPTRVNDLGYKRLHENPEA